MLQSLFNQAHRRIRQTPSDRDGRTTYRDRLGRSKISSEAANSQRPDLTVKRQLTQQALYMRLQEKSVIRRYETAVSNRLVRI